MSDARFTALHEFDFYHRLAEIDGIALVLFSSPDCGACRRVQALLPEVVTDARLFRVDVQQDPGLAKAFAVFHLPALFVYRDGTYHAELKCEVMPVQLRAALAEALAGPPEEEP